jgi:hypothetical protein
LWRIKNKVDHPEKTSEKKVLEADVVRHREDAYSGDNAETIEAESFERQTSSFSDAVYN